MTEKDAHLLLIGQTVEIHVSVISNCLWGVQLSIHKMLQRLKVYVYFSIVWGISDSFYIHSFKLNKLYYIDDWQVLFGRLTNQEKVDVIFDDFYVLTFQLNESKKYFKGLLLFFHESGSFQCIISCITLNEKFSKTW